MRIGNFWENRLGRNDGNPLYAQTSLKRLQFYGETAAGKPANPDHLGWFASDLITGQKKPDRLAEEFAKKLWAEHKEFVEVDHLFPTGEINAFGTYDLTLHVDWGEDALLGILPYEPKDLAHPMAYWASDTHINNGIPGDSYPHRLEVAKKADFVFVAQKQGLERMKKDGIANPILLPHAFEPHAYYPMDLATKRYDVCFVGHVISSNRVDALDRLFKEFPNFFYGQRLFDEASRKFNESKICFNISMTDDINMRTYEVMGSKAFLLTNWIPNIEDFFEDGKHLVLYRTLDEMVEKAKYYLAHDDEREKIAQAGYEEVMKKHTMVHRVSRIVEEFVNSRELAHV